MTFVLKTPYGKPTGGISATKSTIGDKNRL
jgi:hypothetical protein